MELEGRTTPLEVKEGLNQVLPQGIEIVKADEVPLSSSPSSLIPQSVYWIPLDHLLSKEEAIKRLKKALKEKELLLCQERKGKKRRVDVRPLIEKMEVKEGERRAEETNNWGVELVLRRGMGRTAKPTEIIGAILGLEEEPLSRCHVVKIE
jgi:radical SAM-linked protein